MQRTNLLWDNYFDYLNEAMQESKFWKRAEWKPMSTPKSNNEAHISTRASHMQEAANIAKRLAEKLGLNERLMYTGMLAHDAGHPFSAHEGEEIFTHLGEILNTQYFHHNAKGIEILLSEDICGKAIDKIPTEQMTPELRKKLEEEFMYILDIVISHDGEASAMDMTKSETKYDNITDAVITKSKKSSAENDYKFVAQTPEGKLAKYADVIAYLASDMQDAFRLNIIKKFSDDYIEFFGRMYASSQAVADQKALIDEFCKLHGMTANTDLAWAELSRGIEKKRDNRTEEDAKNDVIPKDLTPLEHKAYETYLKIRQININEGNKLLDKIRRNHLTELNETTKSDLRAENDIEVKEVIGQILEKIKMHKLDLFENSNEIQNIINDGKEEYKSTKILEYIKRNINKEATIEDVVALEDKIVSKLEKDEELTPEEEACAEELNYLASKLAKIEKYTTNMCRYSTNVVYEISKKVQEFFIDDLCENSKDSDIPQLSKLGQVLWFRAKELNYKEFVLYTNWDYQTEEFPKATLELVKKGADSLIASGTIRHKLYDEFIRNFVKKIDPEAFKYMKAKYRRETQKDLKSKPTSVDSKMQSEKLKYLNKVKRYVEGKDVVFGINYINTFHAISKRVRDKIELALSDTHQTLNPLFAEEAQLQLDTIRDEILTRFGTLDVTDEQKEEYIKAIIENERNNMERQMAIQLTSDYLAGMTDRSFSELGINMGVLDRNIFDKAKRGEILSSTVQTLTATACDAQINTDGDENNGGDER